jgi:hypothetical protein
VIAVGAARGETIDTTRAPRPSRRPGRPPPARRRTVAILEHDWIRGDTVIGYFAPRPPVEPEAGTEPADTAVTLQRLVARGAAQSLYRIAREGTEPGPRGPWVNYLSGSVIELTFADGELDVASVEGLRRGLYLEPVAAGAGAAAARRAPPRPEDGPAGSPADDAGRRHPGSSPQDLEGQDLVGLLALRVLADRAGGGGQWLPLPALLARAEEERARSNGDAGQGAERLHPSRHVEAVRTLAAEGLVEVGRSARAAARAAGTEGTGITTYVRLAAELRAMDDLRARLDSLLDRPLSRCTASGGS